MIGIAYVAILPPFEGFDESAHLSRVKEISLSPQSALNAKSFIDQSIFDFAGPVPYSSGNPPYNLGNIYPLFFANHGAVLSFVQHYQKESFGLGFTPSNKENWQIQHPPLYYLLISPIFNCLGDFSFLTQLTILRLFSLFISIGGFFLGYLAFKNIFIDRNEEANPLIGFAFYPIIFPMFFLEFARVGNDSLCIFFIGTLSYYLSLWLKNKDEYIKLVVVGAFLGAGLLTKAFFIPITIGMLFFLAFQYLYYDNSNFHLRDFLRALRYVLIPVILIGGTWYLFKFFSHGDFGIGGEASELVSSVGVWNGLMRNFNFLAFIRGLLVPLVSFSWAGTWSLVRLPIVMQLPMLLLGAWIFSLFIKRLKYSALADYESLALLMFIFLYFGLAVHVLISMALTGLGTSGGWYLHILSPWLAPAVGKVLHSILRDKFQRLILLVLVIYSLLFQWGAIWSHMALFSGCAVKDDDKVFLFLGSDFCLNNSFVIFERLQIIASPFVSIFLFVLGFYLLIITMLRMWKIEATH
jgi:hypothetical protein